MSSQSFFLQNHLEAPTIWRRLIPATKLPSRHRHYEYTLPRVDAKMKNA